MSEVLVLAVPILSVVVLLLMLRGVRPIDAEGGPSSLRIPRRYWLALALFFLTFAIGDSVVLLIEGGMIKHLALIVPAIVVAACLTYKAQSTPA